MPKTPTTETQMTDEELDLDPALESQAAEEPEAVETPDEDEAEDEGDEVDTPAQQREEMIPKSRFDEVNARTRMLEQTLQQIQTQMGGQPAQRQQQVVEEPDPYEGLTPEAKNWAQFINRVSKREIDKRVKEEITRLQQEQLVPLQRDNVVVKDLVDDQRIRRQFRDYGTYEEDVKQLREQWYRDTGVLAPREYAYAVAKLRRGQLDAPTARTASARSKAKAGATTQSKTPTRKVAPKRSVTMDDVGRMSEQELEKIMVDNKMTF